MLQHLDDPIPHELPPNLIDDVRRRAARLRRTRVTTSALVAVLAVVCLAGATFAWVVKRDGDIQRVQLAGGVLAEEVPSEPIDIVLVGSDQSSKEVNGVTPSVPTGRADAVMLLRLDPSTGSLRIVSFPRDLVDPRTGGRLTDTLLDHDPSAIVESVHVLLPLPIHHYIALDFSGFIALVNELGGVDLNVSAAISDAMTGLELPAGCSHLDGSTALGLVRARHLVVNGVADPTADLGRTKLQQAFVIAALASAGHLATDPLALDRYARILADHASVDSTLDLEHLVALGRQLRDVDAENVVALTFPSTPAMIDGKAMLTSTAADATTARMFLLGDSPDASGDARAAEPSLTITPC